MPTVNSDDSEDGEPRHGLASAARVGRVLACALTLLVAAEARGSEPEIAGMGPRSAAMAGTGTADASSWDAVYANPAGLMDARRRSLSVGYVFGSAQLDMDGVRRKVRSTNALLLGAAVPLGFRGYMKDRLALGFAFYFPTSVLNRALAPFPSEPRLALLDNRTQVVTASAALAARLHQRVSLGVGVIILATLVGDVLITSDIAGRITTLIDEQIVVRYAPIVGLRVDPHRTVKLGLVFRGESSARYDVLIQNDLGNTLPVALPPMRIAGTAQFDPMQLQLEAAWKPRPFINLVGAVAWKHWSSFSPQTENATEATPPQPDTGFHDTVVPRIALEAGRFEGRYAGVGRLGYFFEWSPAPQPGTVLLDADRHVISAGANFTWRHRYGALAIDAFGQFHQLAGASRVGGNFFLVGLTVGEDL